MRIAYFDCFSGASGDMILGALVDAGLDIDRLRGELAKLPLEGYRLTSERVVEHGLAGTRLRVEIETGPQPHRRLREVLSLIQASSLAPKPKERSAAVFHRLAEAEARVHGTAPEEVEFHELGAVDAIVDIVGAVVGLEMLEVTEVYSSPLPAGGGMVVTAHGQLPVPAPATLELLRSARAPLRPGPGDAELLTPTGAAILTTLALFSPAPTLRLEAVGYGFGGRKLPWPNALRIWLGEPVVEGLAEDTASLIETNIDDMPPELLGYAMERLLAAGAWDVYFTPIQMKKNRPAVKLSVLGPPALGRALAELVLQETTTLGVRLQRVERLKCQRWTTTVSTPFGPLPAKVKEVGGKLSVGPEYEACRRIAQERGLPLAEVYAAVTAAFWAAPPQRVPEGEGIG